MKYVFYLTELCWNVTICFCSIRWFEPILNRTHIYSLQLIVSEWKIVFVFNNINVVYLFLANEFTLHTHTHTHVDTQAYLYIYECIHVQESRQIQVKKKKRSNRNWNVCDKFTQVLTLFYSVFPLNQCWALHHHHHQQEEHVWNETYILFSSSFSVFIVLLSNL